MPDRATILAATPKCPVPLPRCCLPMEWRQAERVWVCPSHGVALKPATLLARRSTIVARPQPAPS